MVDSSRVEALLFDMGGVVIGIDFELAIKSWAERSRLSLEDVRDRFSLDAVYEKHERGEIDVSEYFEHLRNWLELEGNDEEIARGWNSIYTGEIAESTRDIAIARSQLPCYAFTNTNPTHLAEMHATYPSVMSAFDRVFASSDLGLRKPERAAFEAIGEAVGAPLSGLLFFDDLLENVEGAREAGLQAVHVRSYRDVRRALIDIGALARDHR